MARASIKSAKRFGVRYGRRNKERVARAESSYRTNMKSPFCNKNTAKRIAAGIFVCTKTGKVFTGRAYSTERTSTQ